MKIHLIFSRKFTRESNIAPLGIMSLAASLRVNGYQDIRLFDMAFDSKEKITGEVAGDKPDIIGLSTDSISFENGVDLLDDIRKNYKGGFYIIGGVHPSIAPKQALLKSKAAVAVMGEGEDTIIELVRSVENSGCFSHIRGIAYITDGEVIQNDPRAYISDLDTIPFPARDLISMERYLKTAPDIPMLYPTITLFASRGCKGNCIYCQPVSRRLFGRKMRQRSVDKVVEEITALKDTYSFNNLYFTDDELLFNGRKWIEELCESLIDKDLNIRWTCQARVDQISEDLVKLMKRAGCYAIGFGVESGSLEILKYMRKGYRVEQIHRAFDICRRNKLITTCNLMIGTPGETHGTVQDSIRMLHRIRPNLIRCSITTPTPGSDLFTKLEEEDRINVTRLSDFDRWLDYPIRLDHFSKEDIQFSIRKLSEVFYGNLFHTFFNPLKFMKEFYFFKILLLRYFHLLKEPVRLWKDILFYLNYFRQRKGHEAKG